MVTDRPRHDIIVFRHVSTYGAYVNDGEEASEATSYYCGPRSSYSDIDAGSYGRMRADMLQVGFDWKGMQWNVMGWVVMEWNAMEWNGPGRMRAGVLQVIRLLVTTHHDASRLVTVRRVRADVL